MSIKTDAAYARRQLEGMYLTAAHSVDLVDRVGRALDALERIEANAPDEGDPRGTPALAEFSWRRVPYSETPDWLDLCLRDKWVPVGSFVVIDSHSTCGPAGRQTFPAVAVVFQERGPNPGVFFRGPTTVGLTEKLVAYVKTRPWEDRA